ncbi:hypothetical protein BDZ89DRAFT_907766, partial [Hymenopellis radicata]
ILSVCDFSLSTFYRAKRRFRLTGDVAKAKAIGRGRPRLLAESDARYLLALCRSNPTTFLDEYRDQLERYRHLPVCLSTIHYMFTRFGLDVKKVQKMAQERSLQKRADFVRRIGRYPASYIVSMDEVSKDDRTYARMFGR